MYTQESSRGQVERLWDLNSLALDLSFDFALTCYVTSLIILTFLSFRFLIYKP